MLGAVAILDRVRPRQPDLDDLGVLARPLNISVDHLAGVWPVVGIVDQKQVGGPELVADIVNAVERRGHEADHLAVLFGDNQERRRWAILVLASDQAGEQLLQGFLVDPGAAGIFGARVGAMQDFLQSRYVREFGWPDH